MNQDRQASEDFLRIFRATAGEGGTLRFDRFMELALYHPQVGYYRQTRDRIGYGVGSDFYTSSTSAPIFGELIAAACSTLLGNRSISDYTFVEIGAESGGGVLSGVPHSFQSVQTYRLGDPIKLSGRCVVFSNELFDAQPFRQFVRRNGQWLETAVTLHQDTLVFVELTSDSQPPLPNEAHDGYVIDAPIAASQLATQIAAQPWNGLFIACDYGKSWREIAEACPEGTARAYHRHTQSNDLLKNPGAQDLTCHVCWDWLESALSTHGFGDVVVESQESFFVRHSSSVIAATSTAEASRLSQRKLALLQLLHPSHLGQKFQVLHGIRD
jgi:SAM-dependent MidA family methyltransferase